MGRISPDRAGWGGPLGLLSAERVRQLRAHTLVIDPREPILRSNNGTTFPARADYVALVSNLPKTHSEIASSTLRLRHAGAPTTLVDGMADSPPRQRAPAAAIAAWETNPAAYPGAGRFGNNPATN